MCFHRKKRCRRITQHAILYLNINKKVEDTWAVMQLPHTAVTNYWCDAVSLEKVRQNSLNPTWGKVLFFFKEKCSAAGPQDKLYIFNEVNDNKNAYKTL